ncbi:MAG: hypothetical protein FJ306_00270 [Planctomycetes bacterium]|nr:hypothetical protein [Planctomycetota bacterium]
MKSSLPFASALALGAALAAQSPLDVFPVAPLGYYGWNTPPPITSIMFDLNVTQPVTLQAVSTLLSTPVGVVGSLEIWLTNPGITTYVGNEQTQANWSLAASGRIVGNGTTGTLAALSPTSCQQTPAGGGLALNPGSHGVLVRYVGVNPFLVAVAAPQTFTNAEMTVTGGSLQYTPWGGVVGAPTAAGFNAWSFRGQLIYANGSVPHACAEASQYGAGCYTANGSAYQEWTDNAPGGAAAAASAALTGKSLKFLPSGSGYIMLPGNAAGYIAPTAAATPLTLTDDNETSVTLPGTFNYAGGSTNTLFVHANGYVSVASNNTLPGGPNYIPEIPAMLNAPETAWWSWHDYNPTEAGSGQVKFEVVGTVSCITWDGVESYPTTAANPSTLQFQFDSATGEVSIIWVTIEAAGGTGFLQGSDHIIGFSPGGISPTSGQFNIATLTSELLTVPERFPLKASTTNKPLLGTTVTIDTSSAPNLGLGVNFLSLVPIPGPGIDLGILGAPGCAALTDVNAGTGNTISNLGLPGLSMQSSLPLPNNPLLAGQRVYSQSAWIDATANALGIITSNGLELVLGIF